jgi:hypothetical protein
MPKQINKAADLTPDTRNANMGSMRGAAAVAESLSRYGAGRSILVDREGRIIAGNTATEQYVANGNEDVIVVPTDGTKLVVVQRTDLDLTEDRAARELAHADNRSNQLGYTPNVEIITADMTAGADLEFLWRVDELDAMRGVEGNPDPGALNLDRVPRGNGYELVVVLGTQEEMARARKDIQDLGYYVKQ